MYRSLVLSLIVSLGSTLVLAADAPAKKAPPKAPNPAMAPITDNPKLPRVLLIGDSISIGYTLPTRELLKGKANVHRIPTNGGPTINGLANLDQWLGEQKWDVIHFNWGLHDIRRTEGKEQVVIADYEKNLRELVQRLKKTGAKLIWCTTTPVPAGSQSRVPGDEDRYNVVAAKIMQEAGIAIDDLCAFAKPQMDKIGLPANVHYSDEGSKVLATQVAESITQALKK